MCNATNDKSSHKKRFSGIVTLMVECRPNHWALFRDLVMRAGVFGPSISDAFLATLAIERGATLCSGDEGFRRYDGLLFENPMAA